MKQYATLLCVFITITLFGQNKDRRVPFYPTGRMKSLSVAPDGKIWLISGSISELYYSTNIDSLWHFETQLSGKHDGHWRMFDVLEGISFFNKDTAILTGRVNIKSANGYYLTTDGGKHWQLRNFDGTGGVSSVVTDKQGRAWMVTPERDVLYSQDYGSNWQKTDLPFKRVGPKCICMTDADNGIIGGENNLMVTHDNWKTTINIETPLDQKKYGAGQEAYEHQEAKLTQALRWKNYWVIRQSKLLFYSDVTTIDWKPFPKNILEVETDPETGELFAVTDNFRVVVFDSPEKFRTLTTIKLKGPSSNFIFRMKVSNQQVFVLAEDNCCDRLYTKIDVYRIKDHNISHAVNYTLDKKIPEPLLIKKGMHLTWGTDRKHIYLLDAEGWYMEAALGFDISGFKLIDDSTAIFWDGLKNNYLYKLHDHALSVYSYNDPLKPFFDFPVKSFKISSVGVRSGINAMEYENVGDSSFSGVEDISQRRMSLIRLRTRRGLKESRLVFAKTVSLGLLNSAISDLRLSQNRPVLMRDFKITPKDKRRYKKSVRQFFRRNYKAEKRKMKPFYLSLPRMLDTASARVIKEYLHHEAPAYGEKWFHITFVNTGNDTLFVKHHYKKYSQPWNLPWEVEYKKQYFSSCSAEFSRFINTCIPESFIDKPMFDNSFLMLQMAHHLYVQKGWRLDRKR